MSLKQSASQIWLDIRGIYAWKAIWLAMRLFHPNDSEGQRFKRAVVQFIQDDPLLRDQPAEHKCLS